MLKRSSTARTNSSVAPASATDGGDLKRVNSYQWPSGHVGHLSEGQRGALEKFKILCEQKGYYSPGDEKTPASHDDETLLRYLRARKFLPQDAFAQFKDTEDWRQENELDTLYETMDVNEFEAARRLYPQWIGRRDKRGIPVYVFEISHLKAKDIDAYQSGEAAASKEKKSKDKTAKAPRKMLVLFALYENMCRFVLPLCSAIPDRPNGETPVSQSSNIVDMSKVSLRQLWNLKQHMQDSSNLATAHYPETLDHIFVVGAPSFFPTVWEWVKRWFDPITVAKISILPANKTLEMLQEYIHIDNIPKKYGGNLEWNFGDMPFLAPEIANSLRWKEDIREHGHRTLPIGPIKWQYDEDGDLVAVETGTQNGAPRNRTLAGLKMEAHVARLALSPGRNEKSTLFATASRQGASTQKSVQATNNENAASIGAVVGAGSEATTASTVAEKDKMAATPADPDLSIGKTADSAVQDTSRAGTYTVPYRDHENEVHSPPLDSRQGTSATRFEQQANTHAEDTLADGTPSTREDSQGTKHTVMEPRTVGQAPKETPLYSEGDEKPTMIEQAQNLAGQAYEQAAHLPATVMSAVGLGKKEENVVEEAKKEDSRVDEMEGRQVEEYLRAKSTTAAAEKATAAQKVAEAGEKSS